MHKGYINLSQKSKSRSFSNQKAYDYHVIDIRFLYDYND